MSNFNCEKCGAVCCDSEKGYTTGCEHYPPDLEAMSEKDIKSMYFQYHVSDMRDKPEKLKKIWSAGQELYLKNRR